LNGEIRAFADPLEITIERALELAVMDNARIKIAESDVTLAGETRRQAHKANAVSVTHNSSYTNYQEGAIPLVCRKVEEALDSLEKYLGKIDEAASEARGPELIVKLAALGLAGIAELER
jgi:hypothetical protein